MNKQELIEALKNSYNISKQKYDNLENSDWNYAKMNAYHVAYELAEQLDEPEVEECEIIEIERNDYVSDFKCSRCKTSFDLFRWIYAPNSKVNYCPNCGRKIKKGE